MKISINGEIMEAEAHAVAYPNDLLDGCLLDLGDNYAFLSDHVESHREAQSQIGEMEWHDMSDADIDYDEAPHAWVVESVGRLVVQTCEELIAGE